MHEAHDTIEQLLARCRRDQHAWINGDASAYALPEGGMMMPALGGVGAGGPGLAELQGLASALWEAGSGSIEFLDGGVSGDLAWLVMVEHAQVKFMGRRSPARWELRVTELFRRSESGWQRFHRHADPLVWAHSIDEALDLIELDRNRTDPEVSTDPRSEILETITDIRHSLLRVIDNDTRARIDGRAAFPSDVKHRLQQICADVSDLGQRVLNVLRQDPA